MYTSIKVLFILIAIFASILITPSYTWDQHQDTNLDPQNNTQKTIPPIWAKKYYGSTSLGIYNIEVVDDGQYIVAGIYSNDLLVFKIDQHGHVVWKKRYGGNGYDYAYDIEASSDGGYIVIGCTGSFGSGYCDIWALKLNENGDIVWQKAYGGNSYDYAYDVEVTNDGGYIIVGSTNSFGFGGYDIWVLKLDQYGNVVWQKVYGENYYSDYAYDVEITYDGYVIIGYSSKYDGILLIIKLDENGNIIWQKAYDGPGSYDAFGVVQTNDNGYMIVGSVYSSYGGRNFSIIKVDQFGNPVWAKIYDYYYDGIARDIKVVDNYSYVISGNNIVFKIDQYGNIVWQKKYSAGEIYDIEITKDHRYIAVTSNGYVMKVDRFGDLYGCYSDFVHNVSMVVNNLSILTIGYTIYTMDTPGNTVSTQSNTYSPLLSSTIACYFQALGIVGVNVHNVEGQSMSTGGIMNIDLYEWNGSNWAYYKSFEEAYEGGVSSVLMYLSNLSYRNQYLAKVYNIPYNGSDIREYWGSLVFNYTGEYSPSPPVLDFYKTTPCTTDVGAPSRVLEGAVFTVNVSIYVPKSLDGLKLMVVFDRDGNEPWDSIYTHEIVGWIDHGELLVEFQHALDVEGSYQVFVMLYSGDGTELYDFLICEQPVNVGSTIGIRIHNIQGFSMPEEGGVINVELYEYNNGNWLFVGEANAIYTGSEEYVQVNFSDMEFKHYLIKVFNMPNYGLGVEELWGTMEFDYNLQDYVDFYRKMPYITSVTIPSRTLVGQPVTVNVEIKVPETINGVSFEITFDRDGNEPWDSVYTYNYESTIYPGDKVFQFQHPLGEEGSYQVYVIMRSIDNEFSYSQWGWEGPLDIVYGSITLRIHDRSGIPLPSCGGTLHIDVYQRSAEEWEYVVSGDLSYSGNEYYVTIELNDILIYDQQYMVKVTNELNEGLLLEEYWGSTIFTYSNQGVIDIYRTTPYISGVSVPSAALAGEILTINVTITIQSTIDGFKISVILDDDGKEPWDHIISYREAEWVSPSERTYSIQYIPGSNEIGVAYNVYVVLYSKDDSMVYSQLGWEGPVYIYPPIINVTELIGMINSVNETLTEQLNELGNNIEQLSEETNKNITLIKSSIEQEIGTLTTQMNQLNNKLNQINQTTYDSIDQINSVINDINTRIQSLEDSLFYIDTMLTNKLNTINSSLQQLVLITYQNITSLKISLEQEISTLSSQINVLQKDYKQADQSLQEQLEKKLSNTEEQLHQAITMNMGLAIIAVVLTIIALILVFITRRK
ncbi:MAG: hypothetical protein DRO40_06165 [Thermoprotei archaeon]|nr:MAG: hypothetical protein DRO40_06165 [Thermoprotei archaeon]